MNIDRAVMLLAGAMNLAGLVLAWLVHPYWAALSVFVSLNLIQASMTRWCPAAIIFRKLGVKSGKAFS